MYTLWISLPTESAAGDITITDGKGKFYSFFWSIGVWTILSNQEQAKILDEWIASIPLEIETLDARAIRRAVLMGAVVRG